MSGLHYTAAENHHKKFCFSFSANTSDPEDHENSCFTEVSPWKESLAKMTGSLTCSRVQGIVLLHLIQNRMGPKEKLTQPSHSLTEEMKRGIKLNQDQTDSRNKKLNYTCQWFTCSVLYFSFSEYYAHNMFAHSVLLPMLLLPPALLNILARAGGCCEQGNQASLSGSRQHTQLLLCFTDPIPFHLSRPNSLRALQVPARCTYYKYKRTNSSSYHQDFCSYPTRLLQYTPLPAGTSVLG